jgi:hypothetical protein
MRVANKEFKFRSPSKLLDFGDANVADVVGITDKDLQAVHELEEMVITDVNRAACATEVNVCPTPI